MTVKDIEAATHIRALYISAIEDGHYHVLPGEVYLKGFIRNYANLLGLDSVALLTLYKEGLQPPAPAPEPGLSRYSSPPRQRRRHGRRLLVRSVRASEEVRHDLIGLGRDVANDRADEDALLAGQPDPAAQDVAQIREPGDRPLDRAGDVRLEGRRVVLAGRPAGVDVGQPVADVGDRRRRSHAAQLEARPNSFAHGLFSSLRLPACHDRSARPAIESGWPTQRRYRLAHRLRVFTVARIGFL